jgi:hypothetical protein
LIDDSDDEQGQAERGYMRTHNEKGRLEPGQTVINQSKIRWALNIFKPFKPTRIDGIVPALLQQGVEHLVPHL